MFSTLLLFFILSLQELYLTIEIFNTIQDKLTIFGKRFEIY